MGIVLAIIVGLALALVAIFSGYAVTYFVGLISIALLLGLYFAGREALRQRSRTVIRKTRHISKPIEQLSPVPVATERRRLH